MPDKIISSLESQLSRLLGKKESKKWMWLLVVHLALG